MDALPVIILTFYRFHPLTGLEELRDACRTAMRAHDIRGTLLLAPEGINATLAGEPGPVLALFERLRALPGFEGMTHRASRHAQRPFGRGMVKIREELISLGGPLGTKAEAPLGMPRNQGGHVAPEAWNDLIARPDMLLIDGRNSYEARLGSFRGAIDLGARDFKDFPALLAPHLAAGKRIAMFCTGGIRCEKLARHCLSEGAAEIYQLEGGILHYLERVAEEESTWEGACYVFDERIAVGHGLRPVAPASFCPACGHPLGVQDWAHPHFYPGIRCGYCAAHRHHAAALRASGDVGDPSARADARSAPGR